MCADNPCMTDPFMRQKSKLGILGAGRLGRAIGLRWQSIEKQKIDVWSRRFEVGDGAPSVSADDLPFVVAPIASVMSAETVFAALPSSALAALAARHRSITEFSGTLLVTGIDLPLEAIQRLTPAALVVRVVPALLSSPRFISSLVLDCHYAGPRWQRAKAVLEMLGPIEYLDDEQAFESIMYLTSPFPVVLRNALADAVAGVLTQRRVDPKWQPLAERVLWDALSSVASGRAQSDSLEGAVATPGGVTAAGIHEVPTISRVLQDALQIMMCHGERR
jgi:pyrroline-5-carboxylate reductase